MGPEGHIPEEHAALARSLVGHGGCHLGERGHSWVQCERCGLSWALLRGLLSFGRGPILRQLAPRATQQHHKQPDMVPIRRTEPSP